MFIHYFNKIFNMRFTLVFATIASVLAWNSETHLLTTRLAYDILKKEAPEALTKAEELLAKYSDDITAEREGNYKFVECVTWADDSKRRGGGWQSNWHFDDQPFIGDKSKPSDLNIKYDEKNITTVMPAIFEWLSGNEVNNFVIDTIKKHTKSEDEARSLALRLLIHFMGDVHQPLHTSDRYTKEHPDGDKGGNDFILKYHYSAKELHAVWDEVVYDYHTSVKRPFTADSFAEFGDIATELMNAFSFTKSEVETTDFASYRDESFAIAQHVYDGLKEGTDQVLPDTYLSKYEPIAKKRASLAGHRLAYVIEQIFGRSNTSFLQ